jgi:zinc transporter 5/7
MLICLFQGHSHSHGHGHSNDGGHGHGHSHSSHGNHHNDHSHAQGHPRLDHKHRDPNHGHELDNGHQHDCENHGHGHEDGRVGSSLSRNTTHQLDISDRTTTVKATPMVVMCVPCTEVPRFTSFAPQDNSHSHGPSYSPAISRKVPEPLKINPQPYLDVPDAASSGVSLPSNEPAENIANASPPTPFDAFTPLTPSYSFTHDTHLAQHHPEIHTRHGQSDEGHSHNMRGVFLHVLADTLGSVGVILSTLLIRYYGWTGFDPIASLFIAVLIAASVWPLVQETGRLLALDLGDEGERHVRAALNEVGSVQGVAGYSAPRFWMRDTGIVVGSLRVHLEPWFVQELTTHGGKGRPSRLDGVREGVEQVLQSKIPGLEEVVVQLDG